MNKRQLKKWFKKQGVKVGQGVVVKNTLYPYGVRFTHHYEIGDVVGLLNVGNYGTSEVERVKDGFEQSLYREQVKWREF